MHNIRILGVNVIDRLQVAAEVQKVLTRYGCSIKTRLGLSDNDGDDDQGLGGLIILELTGDILEWQKLENELLSIDGVDVSKMDFFKAPAAL
ncbi:MAG: hypothetical protein ACM3PX_06650 [Omnitrophica WOR_2 bacterium]|jgi:hypothetical protein